MAPIITPIITAIITHMPADIDIGPKSTFVFADLAGFAALTEAHGDVEATEIAAAFADRVRALLPEYEAEEIKRIGDEVMIRVSDPRAAVRLGLRIVDELAAPGSPPVRVGMHSGTAVPLNADWFGGTVNLAARVAGAARAGEVLLTEETRRSAGAADGIELEPLGLRHFRHLPDPVAVYRAVGPGGAGHHLEIDPVCRMAVDPADAAGVGRRRGYSYYFCSPDCERAFAADPRRYVAASPAARAARKGFLVNLGIFLVVGGAHLAALASGSEPHTSMFILFGAWAIAVALHYRAVRLVL